MAHASVYMHPCMCMKTCTFVKLALSPDMFIPLDMFELFHLGLNGGERCLGAEGRPWDEVGEGSSIEEELQFPSSSDPPVPGTSRPPRAVVPVPAPYLEPTHPVVPGHTHTCNSRGAPAPRQKGQLFP